MALKLARIATGRHKTISMWDSFHGASLDAISIGGDSDTLAAITGGIAEAFYGIHVDIRESALTFLDKRLLTILNDFESVYGRYS